MKNFITKNYKIILLYLGVIALFVGGTVFYIFKVNSDNIDYVPNYLYGAVDDEVFKPVDFYSAIQTEAIQYKNDDYTDKKVKVYSNKFSGLKDSKLENKINADVGAVVQEFIEKLAAMNKGDKYVHVNVGANFSNLLSIEVYGMFSPDNYEEEDYKYLSKTFNYNLATGDYLTLNDLFVSNSAAQKFIRSAANDIFTKKYSYDCMLGCMAKKNPDLSSMDDDMLAFYHRYLENKLNFYFDYYGITIITDDETNGDRVSWSKYRDSLAFFERFVTKDSVFKKSDEIFVVPLLGEYYKGYFGPNDKGFLDVSYTKGTDLENKIFDQTLKNTLSNYSGKYYYMDLYGYVYKDTDYNLYNVSVSGTIFTTNKNYLDELVKLVIDEKTLGYGGYSGFGGDSFYDKPKNSNYKIEQYVEYYKIFTLSGELIDDLSKLFAKDYDYQQIIRDILVNEYYYGLEYASSFLDNFDISFSTNAIEFKDKNGDRKISIGYNRFDSDKRKV